MNLMGLLISWFSNNKSDFFIILDIWDYLFVFSYISLSPSRVPKIGALELELWSYIVLFLWRIATSKYR